jgi:hypothetical protein
MSSELVRIDFGRRNGMPRAKQKAPEPTPEIHEPLQNCTFRLRESTWLAYQIWRRAHRLDHDDAIQMLLEQNPVRAADLPPELKIRDK